MIVEVEHVCGHKEKHDFTGDRNAVLEKIERESLRPCLACKVAHSRNSSVEKGLPALTGSHKQVAWAENIRNKYIVLYKEVKDKYEKAPAHAKIKYQLIMLKLIKSLKEEAAASFWIEHRDNII